jgi:hypothetical protein
MSSAEISAQNITVENVKISASLQPSIARFYPVLFLCLGVVSLGAAFLIGRGNERLAFSYHTAFLYALSLALGALFFVIIQHAASVGWSVVVRRFAESLAATLPFFVVLFIPMIFGMHTLYHHWTDLELVAKDKMLQQKQPYLNETFFYIRAAIYFVVWTILGWFFWLNSLKQDSTKDENLTRKMRKWSYPSIAGFALTLTFASIDWIMSMSPHWYSTMYGVYYFAGAVVSIYALLIVVTQFYGSTNVKKLVNAEHYHDLGKLLFGHTVFWTYIAFSQYFLMWYAAIPEETEYFAHRMHNGWENFGLALIFGHFVFPFFYLLSRWIKRSKNLLLVGAVWQLVFHFIDIFWLVMPNQPNAHGQIAFIDILCVVGVCSLVFSVGAFLLRNKPLVPVGDPRLPESLKFENF